MDVVSSADLLIKTEHVKYRTAGSGKSPIGTLCVYNNRVEWSAPSVQSKLIVHFSKIKNQRISPPSKPKVQLQLCMENDDQATFVFMKPNVDTKELQNERDSVREILQQALIEHRKLLNQNAAKAEKTGNQEINMKQKILEENAHIQSLYLHLVREKLISPQDFWSFYYKPAETSKTERVGISSGFLSSIEQSQSINGVKLSLKTDTIQAIFRTYPAVERKHFELVPHEMTEEEFWLKFFQSHYFHRERSTNESGANDPFADCAKMDEKDMKSIVEQNVGHLKRQRDLSYLKDDLGIFSEMRDNQMSLKSNMAKAMLVKRCNYHSERVLSTLNEAASGTAAASADGAVNGGAITTMNGGGVAEGANAGSSVFDMELESQDLEALDREDAADVLLVNMPSTSFSTANHLTRYPSAEAAAYRDTVRVRALRSVMEEEEKALGEEQKSAKMKFLDFIATNSLSDSFDGESVKLWYNGLDGNSIEKIRVVHACLAELLRHFWSCFPPITPDLEEKMERMNDTLAKFERTQLRQCGEEFGPSSIKHCTKMLEKAKERFRGFQKAKGRAPKRKA